MNLIKLLLLCTCLPTVAMSQGYVAPEGLIYGGQFLDHVLPTPLVEPLRSDVWGGDNVLPRDVANGIEDQEYSYWGGKIIEDGGKYHMYPCRWREDNTIGARSGHMTWGSSEVVHAVSDNPLGPYKVLSVIGKGHNPEIYRRPNGDYHIGVIGFAYRSKSLYGPWEPIETTIQWHSVYGNVSNKTYVVRPDKTSIMMNQAGKLFISENADENFIEFTQKSIYETVPKSGDSEDPLIWRDEVQYHCLYNSPHDREGFYMRSEDGVHWKLESGLALVPNMVKHPGGVDEDWLLLERPKVIVDEYGRATHLNVAVMDAKKTEDVANDNHSSKNVVMPLRLSRRMLLLNYERVTKDTESIYVKILAEEGFDPINDLDLESLRFGAAEVVNFGGGAKARSIRKDGQDAIITFNGEGNGFEDHNFAGKLLGRDKDDELIYGYAKMRRAPSTYRDEIGFHTINNEIFESGKLSFATYYYTKEPRRLCADLEDLTTNEIVGQVSKNVDGKDITVMHFATKSDKALIVGREYKFHIYLRDKNGEVISPRAEQKVTAISNDAKDEITWVEQPKKLSINGDKLKIHYQTKGERDIYLCHVKSNPWRRINLRAVKRVNGSGVAEIDFEVQPSDTLVVGGDVSLKAFLATPNGGLDGRKSKELNAQGALIE